MEIDVGFVSKLATMLDFILILIFCIWSIILGFKSDNFKLNSIMTNINLMIVNAVLLLGETKRVVIVEKFYFACNQFGRGLFCLFIALWLFAENNKTAKHTNMHDFGLSVAICTTVIGVLYIIQHFLVFVEFNHFSLTKDNSQQQIDQWFQDNLRNMILSFHFSEIISILSIPMNILNKIRKFSIIRFNF
ncbi:unnamed protein product [Paramecium octaurelia]|uniref:Uncharacterized protein n=1 Tax=Paramecium octaurelia TaxID=43137 RepID=A0A8S1UNP3_PAROT|nr:unnamed protein product [Paramecium octaurelia]